MQTSSLRLPRLVRRSSTIAVSSRYRRYFSELAKKTGLYSIKDLQQPNDFLKLASQARRDGDRVRSFLNTATVSDLSQAREILFKLDEISRIVCNVVDAAELCRNTHANAHWRSAANEAFVILSDYIAQLNGDSSLYNAMQQVVSGSGIVSNLSQEEKRFVLLLKGEFEREGIHLPADKRSQLTQLISETVQLETAFSQNIVTSRKEFAADTELVCGVIPQAFLRQHGFVVDKEKTMLTGDQHILGTLLRYSGSPKLRKEVYMESNTTVPENLEVLDDLIRVRHETSLLLGYPSYADRFLSDKMAQNPTNVLNFLNRLLETTSRAYKDDMQKIAAAKRAVEGSAVVEPWDPLFYSTVLKAQSGFDINTLSNYLSVDQSLDAIAFLVNRLFGIRMVEDTMDPNETWDVDESGKKISGHNLNIRKYNFFDSEDVALGSIYFDLYRRPHKYGGAAHFTIRCGCLENGPNDPSSYQLPVVALVCNFSDKEQLAHAECETLLHETGHAIHSLLSRTSFQHMSGVRAPVDFVETPSHLLENFAWDPQFLRVLGRDSAGNSIPNPIVEQLRNQRYSFQGLDRHLQVVNAIFDQKLFSGNVDKSTSDLLADLRLQHGIPHARGTHWHTGFGHLVSYGAGYYSYAYCQVFAADIWSHLFHPNSLSPESGSVLWKKMLIHGGAKDPSEILVDLLGRLPRVEYSFSK